MAEEEEGERAQYSRTLEFCRELLGVVMKQQLHTTPLVLEVN